LLRQEQAAREAQSRRIAALEEQLATRASMPARIARPQASPTQTFQGTRPRAVKLRRPAPFKDRKIVQEQKSPTRTPRRCQLSTVVCAGELVNFRAIVSID
jgi:hypothetical protein